MDMETVGFSEVLASFYQSVPGDILRKAIIVVFAKNVCGGVGGRLLPFTSGSFVSPYPT